MESVQHFVYVFLIMLIKKSSPECGRSAQKKNDYKMPKSMHAGNNTAKQPDMLINIIQICFLCFMKNWTYFVLVM